MGKNELSKSESDTILGTIYEHFKTLPKIEQEACVQNLIFMFLYINPPTLTKYGEEKKRDNQ